MSARKVEIHVRCDNGNVIYEKDKFEKTIIMARKYKETVR